MAARLEAHRRIAHENGARILADPSVALTALTHQRATFTEHDLVRFLYTRTDGAERMAGRAEHRVSAPRQTQVLAENGRLSSEQRGAFQHVVGGRDLAVLVGVAGSGKSTLLAAARHGWEAEGLTVKRAALSGMAAENLEGASGITAREGAALIRKIHVARSRAVTGAQCVLACEFTSSRLRRVLKREASFC